MLTARAMLGIDLRITSVKVVELEKTAANYVIKKWDAAEVPYAQFDQHPQFEDAKAGVLRQLIAKNKIKTKEAIVVTAGSDSVVKLFSLPAMPAAEAAEAIKWKFAEELQFPIEEALLSYYALPKTAASEKTDYLAACLNRRVYRETEYILKKAGLKLAGITVMPYALQELYRQQISQPEEKITSIIYLGKRSTNISIFRRGVFEFNRELAIGGETITQAMTGLLVSPEGRVEVTAEEAERIKVQHGIPIDLEHFPKLDKIPLTQLQAMVRPALEKIQSEISRTFEYYKGLTGEGAVNKIILTGGSVLTGNLKEFLSRGLGIPIETPEPLPGLNPRLSAAVGAALTGAQPLNLMPEEVKFRWKALELKFMAPQYLAGALAGVLALIYLFFMFQAFSLQKELNAISQKMEKYQPIVAQLQVFETRAQAKQTRQKELAAFGQNRDFLPNFFREVSRLIPDSLVINQLTINAAEAHIYGTAFRKSEAPDSVLSRFVLELSLSHLFDQVKLIEAVKSLDYATEAFNFEILGKMKQK